MNSVLLDDDDQIGDSHSQLSRYPDFNRFRHQRSGLGDDIEFPFRHVRPTVDSTTSGIDSWGRLGQISSPPAWVRPVGI